MQQDIYDIDELRRIIAERNEQNNIELITNKIAMVSDIRMGDYTNIMKVNMWAFVLCTSGSCSLTLSHQSYDINRGSLLIYQPNQRFKIEQLSDDCSGKIMCVTSDLVDESMSKINDMFSFLLYVKANPIVQLSENQCDMFERYGKLLLKKIDDSNNLFYREIANNLMTALFFEVFNVYSQNLLDMSSMKTNRDRVFERFLQLVEKHHSEERSIKYYAARMGLTPKYLSKLCREVSGRHAGVWIERFVMDEAKSLLLDTDLTIQQISNRLNFANQSFFGKYFRKHVGMSPSAFRKNKGV